MPYKDKEKERENRKAYYLSHKEEMREWQKTYYLSHREEEREYQRNLYALHKEKGICQNCGKRKVVSGITRCWICGDKQSLVDKKYRQEHRRLLIEKVRKWRDKMRQEGRCISCGAPLVEEENVYCMNCSMRLSSQYPGKKERGCRYEVGYEKITV